MIRVGRAIVVKLHTDLVTVAVGVAIDRDRDADRITDAVAATMQVGRQAVFAAVTATFTSWHN